MRFWSLHLMAAFIAANWLELQPYGMTVAFVANLVCFVWEFLDMTDFIQRYREAP